MSAINDHKEYATKDDISALSNQIDNLHSKSEEPLTAKDLKISLLEFAKEYKLDWINTKINFLLWIVGIATPTCLGYLLYKIDKITDLVIQIITKLPK